ncbi:MAG: hypothetical protein JW918_11185 [Anaerolineae bacterium]|nr:hypothetical protein [Anaerolineae bacterium]
MNLKTRVMIVGGVVGALLGVGAAYLYMQSAGVAVDEEGNERLPAVQPAKALTLGLGVMTLLRQIAGMGK